ncbi:MAG: aminodeoxychorismate synthase component I [Ignavibacteriales bacterium]|nr:aminodeoxychorismate synthase component I [Ignavibacteriales bacterium]
MKRFPEQWIEHKGCLSPTGLQWVEKHPGSILLESNLCGRENCDSFMFVKPVSVIEATRLQDVERSLRLLDEAVRDGYYVAGFLAYEAGYAFEKTLPHDRIPPVPFLWFGLYSEPLRLGATRKPHVRSGEEKSPHTLSPVTFVPGISEKEYFEAVDSIHQYIAAGDTYQVNYTFRLRFPSFQSPSTLYDMLRHVQRVPYSAFLNTGKHVILSFSPELFFRKEGERIFLRPMKGTAPRGRTLEEDETNRRWIKQSQKDRAENLMIVDLLRNDLGRIARPGSVRVKRFFEIERYETVFQATSAIEGVLQKGTTMARVFRSLFPSGSVTGAPKIRTMQIIHQLEREPRGVYTGAIGFISPRRKAVFNVAIRTVVIDRSTNRAEFGVGSGIVHDSGTKDEYNECLLKARFLHETPNDFRLLETIRWDPRKGWFLLRRHLSRLKSSARYFDYAWSRQRILLALQKLQNKLARRDQVKRVRLLLARDGSVETDAAPLEPLEEPVNIAFSATPTNSSDRFLFHKTTNRGFYESALRQAESNGLFDLVFRNQDGEITEGARSTIILRIGDRYVTPPLTSGVLPGTFREHLLRRKKVPLTERVLYPDDITSADEVFVCNALRGLVSARLLDKEFTV